MIKINNNTNPKRNDFSFPHMERHLHRCYNEMGLCRLSDALEPPWAFLKLMSEWRIWWRASMNISCMTHMREGERERAAEMLRRWAGFGGACAAAADAGRLTDTQREGGSIPRVYYYCSASRSIHKGSSRGESEETEAQTRKVSDSFPNLCALMCMYVHVYSIVRWSVFSLFTLDSE